MKNYELFFSVLIDEINNNTDINLTYDPIKKGRSVVGFKFTIKEKSKPKLIAMR